VIAQWRERVVPRQVTGPNVCLCPLHGEVLWFKWQYKANVEGVRLQLGTLQQERQKSKLEISNLAAVIAQGRHSPSLREELEKRERSERNQRRDFLFWQKGSLGGRLDPEHLDNRH
jgi:hypothetical protein